MLSPSVLALDAANLGGYWSSRSCNLWREAVTAPALDLPKCAARVGVALIHAHLLQRASGLVRVSKETLARYAGVSRPSVFRGLAILEKLGLIQRAGLIGETSEIRLDLSAALRLLGVVRSVYERVKAKCLSYAHGHRWLPRLETAKSAIVKRALSDERFARSYPSQNVDRTEDIGSSSEVDASHRLWRSPLMRRKPRLYGD